MQNIQTKRKSFVKIVKREMIHDNKYEMTNIFERL